MLICCLISGTPAIAMVWLSEDKYTSAILVSRLTFRKFKTNAYQNKIKFWCALLRRHLFLLRADLRCCSDELEWFYSHYSVGSLSTQSQLALIMCVSKNKSQFWIAVYTVGVRVELVKTCSVWHLFIQGWCLHSGAFGGGSLVTSGLWDSSCPGGWRVMTKIIKVT